jgi:hypothetical protein
VKAMNVASHTALACRRAGSQRSPKAIGTTPTSTR